MPVAADEPVLDRTTMGYDPLDGASETGDTSGWMIGAPTDTVTHNGAQEVHQRTWYDAEGVCCRLG